MRILSPSFNGILAIIAHGSTAMEPHTHQGRFHTLILAVLQPVFIVIFSSVGVPHQSETSSEASSSKPEWYYLPAYGDEDINR